MNKSWLLCVSAALLAAPLALAHEPAGTPKNYCEPVEEWNTHDYGDPPLMDVILPKLAVVDSNGHVKGEAVDGNAVGDCNGDTVPADYDGHHEWSAAPYALLVAESGDGVTSGGIVCYGEVAHHPPYGPISVSDSVFGDNAPFHVATDLVSFVPPTDPTAPLCGDFETELDTHCVGSCTVTYPPGIDGAYHITVGDAVGAAPATFGHVVS